MTSQPQAPKAQLILSLNLEQVKGTLKKCHCHGKQKQGVVLNQSLKAHDKQMQRVTLDWTVDWKKTK